jgi:hypothetical protein
MSRYQEAPIVTRASHPTPTEKSFCFFFQKEALDFFYLFSKKRKKPQNLSPFASRLPGQLAG